MGPDVETAGWEPGVGDEVEVTVGAVAHGGHCVARHAGRVLFVRHALPGERVRARVTELGPQGRFLRADAVAVLEASPDRVAPPCPYAGPGRCGGCDWQHAPLAAQRRLKAQVVAEQLSRLAGIEREVVCEPVPGDVDGLRWRTRVELAVTEDAPATGRLPGLRAHRSHRVLPVEDCLIAHPGVLAAGVLGHPVAEPGVVGLDVVAPSVGEPVVVPLIAPAPSPARRASGRDRGRDGRRGRHDPRRALRTTPRPAGDVPEVVERVGAHDFHLSARGFWQVHPGAASTFTEQMLTWLEPRLGERALDLYAGVGLFAVPLAEAVGPGGRVLAVEADRTAVGSAADHLAAYPWAEAVAEPTERALARLLEAGERADVIVLDPPRSGAGAVVMEQLASLAPRAVVYVACDPAALARDLRAAREVGLELAELRVLDAFPMTQHVECLALLTPARA